MRLIFAKDGKSDRNNTNMPPTPSTGPSQGQPCHPMPAYFDKYLCTYGWGSHKGGNCNSNSPGHEDKATTEISIDGSNYGFTEWRCGTVRKLATNNNRNILLKSIDSTLVPPNLMSYNHAVLNKSHKAIILKYDTGATKNYIRGQNTIILKNPGPKTTGPKVRLP